MLSFGGGRISILMIMEFATLGKGAIVEVEMLG